MVRKVAVLACRLSPFCCCSIGLSSGALPKEMKPLKCLRPPVTTQRSVTGQPNCLTARRASAAKRLL